MSHLVSIVSSSVWPWASVSCQKHKVVIIYFAQLVNCLGQDRALLLTHRLAGEVADLHWGLLALLWFNWKYVIMYFWRRIPELGPLNPCLDIFGGYKLSGFLSRCVFICSSYHKGPLDSSEVSGERDSFILRDSAYSKLFPLEKIRHPPNTCIRVWMHVLCVLLLDLFQCKRFHRTIKMQM